MSKSLFNKKPLRTILIILFSLIGFSACGFGAFFLAKYIDTLDPTRSYSDADFLVAYDTWASDTIRWSFKPDGTCRLTTNGDEYFDCTWSLVDSTLNITTSWLTVIEDSFTFSFDRTSNSFTVASKSDAKTTTFSPLVVEAE